MEQKKSSFSIWMAQIRINFLLLAVFLVGIGLAITYKHTVSINAEFDFFHAVLIMTGVVLAHISVNLFNEYSDYFTRIDFNTVRSPFSGGTGMMVSGNTSPRAVIFTAVITLLLAFAIGCYFAMVSHWSILVISLTGALTIVLYTPFFQRIMLGEFLSGLTLGSFVVIGTYIAMTATPDTGLGRILTPGVLLISIPPGILTSLLLLINEFPDTEADKQGGRKHLVIHFGKQKAAYIYAFGLFLTFVIIMALPFLGATSKWIFLALIPLPLAFNTGFTAVRHYEDRNRLVKAMGKNVFIVLGTDLLMAVGILI
jgi:1,4-dihydroxy-2-naphthoate polyprenyltransferase